MSANLILLEYKPQRTEQPVKVRYCPALTGVRAAAAMLVFAYHFYGHWHKVQVPGLTYLREGYIGVSIFFTLSAYLITATYFERFRSGSVSFADYWFKRFSRIFPVYLFLLGVRYWLFPDAMKSSSQLLANVTLTQAFFESHVFTGLHPAWSLTVEECFYLLSPAVFLFFQFREPETRRGRVRGAVQLTLLSAFLGWAGHELMSFNAGGDFLGSKSLVEVYSIFGRFPEFAFGIFAAIFLSRGIQLKAQGADALFLGSIGLYGYALQLLVDFRDRAGVASGIQTDEGLRCLWLVSAATVALIIAIVQGSRLAQAIFGNRVSEYLGRISFVAYLLQSSPIFIDTLCPWVQKSLGFSTDTLPGGTLVLVGFSALVYECVEKPAHRYLNSDRFKEQVRALFKRAQAPGGAGAKTNALRQEPALQEAPGIGSDFPSAGANR